MGAAVTALSWELLARCRWWLWLSAGLLVLLWMIGILTPESWRSTERAVWLVVAVAIPMMAVVGSTVHAEGARLEDTGSLFPSRLFTLPVPTIVLVGPPLMLGTLLLLGCWLAFALCILRPWGAEVPLLWPGLLAGAVLASLQALVWWPFPLPWLRACALLIIMLGLWAGTIFLAQRGTPEEVMTGSSVSVLLAAYAAAFIGVSRSRHTTTASGWLQQVSSAGAMHRQTLPPFPSPLEAQKWLERQRLRLGFVLFTLICLITTVPLMVLTDVLVRDLKPEFLDHDLQHLQRALTIFGRSWLVMAQLPLLPLLIPAAVGGSSLGRLSTSADSMVCSPFLATRPMRNADMVAAKLLTCARAMIILWVVMYLVGLLWALCMGRVGELCEHLIARTGSPASALLALTAGMVILPVISWLWLISGMGGKVLRWSILEILPAFFSLGVLVLPGLMIAETLDPWRPILGGIVAVALVAKVCAVGWVVKQVRRERLIQNRTIVWTIAGWAALTSVVLGLCAGLFGLVPLLAGIAVLMLPLARPLATPLVLGRHRTQ